MKRRKLITFFLGIIATIPLFADRGEQGVLNDLNEGSSSPPLWPIVLFAIVGFIAYDTFNDKKSETPKGCIATIIAWIILFAIICFISRLFR